MDDLQLSQFKHTHTITVRNYEIDWQGIVHNGNYLLYFEIARVEYFKAIGVKVDQRSINGPIRIVIVRNELDYLSSATFDDTLIIHTRITAVKNSSFICEAVMIKKSNQAPVAKNISILVWTDPTTGKSMTIPNEIRGLVDVYEQGNVAIQQPITHV
ncbi:MAG: acyl-CoA thioesterase [Bacteroidetes bacterium]|nr:acyl-CoA thioesterase [Bacteroidota bacterium]